MNNKKNIALILLVIGIFLFSYSAEAGEKISIVAVGDIMMGTTFKKVMLPPDDGAGIFNNVGQELKGHDIVFGNLEGPFLDAGEPAKCLRKTKDCFVFRMPTRYVYHLKDTGFNVMNYSNNHTFDFGLRGIESTKDTLISAGIKHVGCNDIAYFEIRGKKIAVVGFSFPSSAPDTLLINDIPNAALIVGELKQSNDIVIVSFHGGAEGEKALQTLYKEEIFLNERRGNVIKFSRAVVDAGADLVIGHGPHVLRAMEVYREKLIVYSLGNFLTYGFNTSGSNGVSAILKVSLAAENGNFMEGELVPIKLMNKGIPEIDADKKAIKLIKKLTIKDRPDSRLIILNDGYLSVF
ncbi:MAG: CapA family protein [Nitrospiraceae bacterium]|nr:CapA family protein [Nitrospiraceae bacterium]